MIKTKQIRISVLAVILITLSIIVYCAENKQTEKKELQIYLLIGQSNMAGRATVELEDSDTLEHIFLYTGIEGIEWEKAANPLNKYSSIRKKIEMQKLGPGYSFAREMAEFSENKQIGLVVNARGGTKIEQWAPGTEYYNEAVKRTKAALKNGTLKGIVWHQGEGNASNYKIYTTKIIELIEALRTEFNSPDLPFVAGQLSQDKPHRKPFNKMIKKLPKMLDDCAIVSTRKTSTIDSTHFNSKSQRLLGERYAREMQKLLAEDK